MTAAGTLSSRVRIAVAGQLAGKLAGAALTLISTTLLVRYLDKGAYGQLNAGLAFGALLAGLNDPGLNQIVLRRQPQPGRTLRDLVGQSLGLSLAVSTAGSLLGVGLSFLVLGPSGHVAVAAAILSCAALVPTGLAAAYYPLYQAEVRLKSIAVSELATRATILLLVSIVVLAEWGPIAAAAAVGVAQIAGLAVVAGGAEARTIRPRVRLDTWASLLREAAPLGLALGIYSFYVKVDMILVARIGTQNDLANYALAYRVIDLTMGLLFALMVVMVGPLATGAAQSPVLLGRRAARIRDGLVVMGSFLAAGGTLLAPLAITLLAGEHEYVGSVRPLSILLVATGFSGLQSAYNTTLVAQGLGRRLLPLMAVLVLANVSANLVLIPRYGATGAALATLGTEVISVAIAWLWLKSAVPLPPLRLRLRLLWVIALGAATTVIIVR